MAEDPGRGVNPRAGVTVVGGGWAGLAAAVDLSRRGARVTLLEAARQLGGRARRVRLGGMEVDNGQHLLLGAYRDTLHLLNLLAPEDGPGLERRRLDLQIWEHGRPALCLRAPRLPAPLHALAALAGARGLSPGERLRAAALGLFVLWRRGHLESDTTVTRLLRRLRQSPRLVRRLWEPLCLATLNTPPRRASARVFVRVLHDALLRVRGDSDLVLATRNLGALLPEPAVEYIEARGGHIHLGRRVTALQVEDGGIRGLATGAGTVPARHVILAVPPGPAAELLAPHPPLAAIAARLNRLRSEPVCTVYLQYPEGVRLEPPLLGLAGATAQWIFDRRVNGQPGLMAVVVSAGGPHMALDNDALVAQVRGEIARVRPRWPEPVRARVIREKRATFSCRAGVSKLRPGCATPVTGLWLAGDYTDTGYPATLEGAVRSGLAAARHAAAALDLPDEEWFT